MPPIRILSTECRTMAASTDKLHHLKDKAIIRMEWDPARRPVSLDSSTVKSHRSIRATMLTQCPTCRTSKPKTIGPDSPTKAFVRRSFAKSTQSCRFSCSSRSERLLCSCSSKTLLIRFQLRINGHHLPSSRPVYSAVLVHFRFAIFSNDTFSPGF